MVVEIFQRRGPGSGFIYKVQSDGGGFVFGNKTATVDTREQAERKARQFASAGERIVYSPFEGTMEVIRQGR